MGQSIVNIIGGRALAVGQACGIPSSSIFFVDLLHLFLAGAGFVRPPRICRLRGDGVDFRSIFQQAVERSASRFNLAFRPVCLGFAAFRTSSFDRALGALSGKSRGRH